MTLPPRVIPQFQKTNAFLKKIVWPQPLQNVFLARKTGDPLVLSKTYDLVTQLHKNYKLNICTDYRTYEKLGLPYIQPLATSKQMAQHIDLILSIGGDGTVLRSAQLFDTQSDPPPPLLPISMGTLGFLLPFKYENALKMFDKIYNNKASATKRSRLRITFKTKEHKYALNDLCIYRGSSPHLAHLDVYMDNQLLTHSIGDGVILSTPTGSTAYSLSAGGSIVHPHVKSMLLTPICPRSLSFRPILLPENASIVIKLSELTRGRVSINIDGSTTKQMLAGDEVHVTCYDSEGIYLVSENCDDWVPRVNNLLGFNSKFGKT